MSLTLLLTFGWGRGLPCHGDIITFQEPLIQLLGPQAGLTSSSQKAREGGRGRAVVLFLSVPTPTQCGSTSCPRPQAHPLWGCLCSPSPAGQLSVLGRGRNLSFLLVNKELVHRGKAGMEEMGKGRRLELRQTETSIVTTSRSPAGPNQMSPRGR